MLRMMIYLRNVVCVSSEKDISKVSSAYSVL